MHSFQFKIIKQFGINIKQLLYINLSYMINLRFKT